MSENPEVIVITDAPELPETDVVEKKAKIKKYVAIGAASAAALVAVLWVKSRTSSTDDSEPDSFDNDVDTDTLDN